MFGFIGNESCAAIIHYCCCSDQDAVPCVHVTVEEIAGQQQHGILQTEIERPVDTDDPCEKQQVVNAVKDHLVTRSEPFILFQNSRVYSIR